MIELSNIERPSNLQQSDLDQFFARWNRTADYWAAGIHTANEVPAGFSADFIDLQVLARLARASEQAYAAAAAQGYSDVSRAWHVAKQLVEQSLQAPQQSVCATVRVQIDQTVSLTRSAFRGTLSLENNSADSLDVVDLDIEFKTLAGADADQLFQVQLETINGIAAFDGSSTLPPASNAQGTWVIIPSNLAAPESPVSYVVSGALTYVRQGTLVFLPLAPTTIEVRPNAELQFKYFVEKYVYADDPFTPILEPSVPFDLGLRVENNGAGSVSNLTVASAQPRIVENRSNLVIDFQLLGSQVGSLPSSPSFMVNLGNFGPRQTNTARWQLSSSLQGRFVEFEASLQNLNGLNSPEFWVIDPQVDVKPMLHSVRWDEGGDDLLLDFLEGEDASTQPPAPAGLDFLPTKVWLSDGTEQVVNVVLQAVVQPGSGSNLSAQVSAPVHSSSANYVRFPDPFAGTAVLTGVRRSDGKVLQVGPNAWQTKRVLSNGPSLPNPRIHIFDAGGDGNYELTFNSDTIGAVVVGWGSYSRYGTSGFYNLRVLGDGSFVDPRFGGPEVLRMAFSEPVNSTTFTPANVRVLVNTGRRVGHVSAPIATTISSDGKIGSIVLAAPIPDKAFVCVNVAGVRDLSGNLLANGTERLTFSTLVGDITGDSRVDQEDVNTIGALVGTNPIDPGNTQHLRADIDRSGAIDAADAAAVQARVGSNTNGVSRACVEPTTPGGG
jgi:hypothetical protein